MGVSLPMLRHLISLKELGALKGDVLLLGRMSPMFNTRMLKRTLLKEGLDRPFVSSKGYENIFRHNPSDVEVFKSLGFSRVYSLDVSSYEGADFVWDLNLPVPENLKNKFDFIYDGGTIEHIFNTPQVLKNLHDLLHPTGYIFHENPANNFVDHGYYQFPPSLFFDYYTANNYEIISALLCKVFRRKNRSYLAYNYLPNRFEAYSYGRWSGTMLSNVVVVRKTSMSTSGKFSQQSRYEELFWGGISSPISSERESFKKQLARKFPKMRYWYIRFRRPIFETINGLIARSKPKPDMKL